MNERIKELRTALCLSAEKFGSRVGVTRSAISRIENGVVNVTEQMILSICREFNVREEWLRDGTGEMFLDFTEDEFSRAAAALSNDAFVKSLIVEYWKLDEDSKKLFRDFIHKLSDNMRGLE
ncbi:MAG: helix-turn-helix domain-containing protein [Ruminococcus flavefaciens]|nr:helix-turn-helix domain-containing protein [Ruminococcus flavefaciens]